MQDCDLSSRDIASLTSTTELMEREWAPCRYNCPVHADVRKYIELAAAARWREAIDVIRERLAFAAVCGRICHHPCEANCRRNEVDSPVAIREVKRFVAELGGSDSATVNKPAMQDKAEVAVIGAGPAGLAAALELAKLGYRPTVFEKFPLAGGIPATAIPKYRMPAEAIKVDVDWILAHGVRLETNVDIGKDKSIDDLLDAGYGAVLIAAGLAKSRTLPIPGAENPRVLTVMEFLTDLAFDRKVDIGEDVLVIGGGNVACDAARSAVRLGAGRVRMMCLEDAQEMPAWEWEITEAVEEGVEVIHRRGPVEIVADGGRITCLKAREVTRVFDEDGKFSPQYDDGDVIDVECDSVIFAIGQTADNGFLEGSGVKLNDRGRLEFNPATGQTNLPNVFACGEIVTPPGSVVEACASGQRAAAAIDMFLCGKPIDIDDSLPPAIDKITPAVAEKVIKIERAVVPTDEPDGRKKVFEEFEHTLDSASAACEARRCMNCGAGAEVMVDKCAACLTCLRVCPFDIPKVTDVARIESALCQACGMCIAACPAGAIVARGRDVGELKRATARALDGSDGGRSIIAYICGHKAPAGAWRGEEKAYPDVAEFYLPSMARLSVTDLLSAFESGADAVIIVACRDDAERYPKATRRVGKRVEQARGMLVEVGMDGGRLQLVEVDGGIDAIRAALAEAVEKAESIASSLGDDANDSS